MNDSSTLMDIVVVVGGKEFQENSYHLCSISNYFGAALNSGMREAQTKRFEFPDKDPQEWELIMSLFHPFATAKIDESNVEMALAWCDELCMPLGIEKCDKVLCQKMKDKFQGSCDDVWENQENIDDLLENFMPKCFPSSLQLSKATCLELVHGLLEKAPWELTINHLESICSLLAEHKECQDNWWNCLSKNMPANMESMKPEEVVTSKLLPALVFAELRRKKTRHGFLQLDQMVYLYTTREIRAIYDKQPAIGATRLAMKHE